MEPPAPDRPLVTVVARLGAVRAAIDDLLARPKSDRRFTALNLVQPSMVGVSDLLELPIERAGLAVTSADPSLSGLLTEERLATTLRDHVGLIAAVTVPRFNSGEQLSASDLDQVRILVAQSSYLVQLLHRTIEMVGGTDRMRSALVELEAGDSARILASLTQRKDVGTDEVPNDAGLKLPQRVLVPWGEQVNVLRIAIVDAIVTRVTLQHAKREREFDTAVAAFGLVVVAVLEAVLLLSRRVVGPLAQLGAAITRIAAGDRTVPLVIQSETREIAEMVTAVETLRQAALVADHAAMRQRMAARQRLLTLRKALSIAQTVRESARALELGVAGLSKGIDATIAAVTAATGGPPASLTEAAAAVRCGLAEMRESAPSLEATFDAASAAQAEDERPEEELLAHVLAVQAEVDRRDATVRGFIQPSLLALRDAAKASAGPNAPALRVLVSDQFDLIESTVAAVASMREALARAALIARGVSVEDTPMAA
jgi:methyl-accepting chemotaxis protein